MRISKLASIGSCLLYLVVWACSPDDRKENETADNAQPSEYPVLLELNQATLRGDTTITIGNDPFFKSSKRYQAFSLKMTLDTLIRSLKDTADVELTFICKDGYAPSMPLGDVLRNNGFLAYKDLDEHLQGKEWADSLATRFKPFYLVWQEEAVHVWPYGLYQIRLNKREDEFAAAIPADAKAMAGFAIFKENCMKCHSMNKVGGVLGPELNFPKNITEYWNKEDIWNFARNPQSYRYNSKMPGQPDLKRETFEAIYLYLSQMQKQKLN